MCWKLLGIIYSPCAGSGFLKSAQGCVHMGDGDAWLPSGYQRWSTAPGNEAPQVGASKASLLPQEKDLGWEQGQGPESLVSWLQRWRGEMGGRGRQGNTSEHTVTALEETKGFLSCLPCPKAQPALTKLLLTDACLTLSVVSTAPSLYFPCSDLFQTFPLLRVEPNLYLKSLLLQCRSTASWAHWRKKSFLWSSLQHLMNLKTTYIYIHCSLLSFPLRCPKESTGTRQRTALYSS